MEVRLSASRPYVMKASPRAVVPRYRYGELPRLARAAPSCGALLAPYRYRSVLSCLVSTHNSVGFTLKSSLQGSTYNCKQGKNLLRQPIDNALQHRDERRQTHGIPYWAGRSHSSLPRSSWRAVDEPPSPVPGASAMVSDTSMITNCHFAKLSDAEQVLTELQGILASFELSLNSRKTRVEELPQPSTAHGPASLGRFAVRKLTKPGGDSATTS